MRKVIAIPLMAAILLIYTVGLITRTAADGFGPDPGFVVNFPPGQVDPFQYGPRAFPDKLPARVRVGSGAAPDESAARLLEPGIFNSLSSAGQRGALMLNDDFSRNRRSRGIRRRRNRCHLYGSGGGRAASLCLQVGGFRQEFRATCPDKCYRSGRNLPGISIGRQEYCLCYVRAAVHRHA